MSLLISDLHGIWRKAAARHVLGNYCWRKLAVCCVVHSWIIPHKCHLVVRIVAIPISIEMETVVAVSSSATPHTRRKIDGD